ELSRDLLQKLLSVHLESFKTGSDNGIDFRHSKSQVSTSGIIVQAKRYSNYSSLLSELKKEVKKLPSLNPERYILVTSAGLSPKNKDEIFKLFQPYIKSTADIFGKEDINNLLRQFPEI